MYKLNMCVLSILYYLRHPEYVHYDVICIILVYLNGVYQIIRTVEYSM